MVRTLARYLTGAALLAVVAAGLLAAAGIERQLAQADVALSTLDLNQAARSYASVDRRLDWSAPVPWLFESTRAELAARKAAVRYWRGEYGSLVADYTAADSLSVAGNLPLQLVVANADYLTLRRPNAVASGPATIEVKNCVAAKLEKIGGGHPTQSAVSKLLLRINGDPEWYPGKRYCMP